MAYKRVTFSWDKWVVDQYLTGQINKSSFVQEMFIKGCDYELSGGISNKTQLILLMKENKIKDETIRKLNLEVRRLKGLTNKAEQNEMIKRRKAINQMAHEELLDVFNDR